MEKRIVALAAACLMAALAFCTCQAADHHRQGLPLVTAGKVLIGEDGVPALPPEAIFSGPGDTSVAYRLIAEQAVFGIERYYVKAIPVIPAPQGDGLVAVRGLYNLDDPYVLCASVPLTDGAEVRLSSTP